MKKIKLCLLLVGIMALTGCEKEKEDEVSSVDKSGSIETELSVEHLDNTDILITKHKIWKDKKLFKEIVKRDTIPSLGDTLVAGEDSNGYDHTAKTKKDYQFFITVQ
ncbi:hypothetical protein HHL23_08690 [Chryseobacterium sp. RP-3-3]|uniref:Uncharacterized protein n=1 Tax=Chryseobacterium antibioticum TaxID=2728847 RepID=A0A7Y0AMA2_9FLAO|nr:hypothetical protein [Chryseobacterium antibioticum]NML69874.1 hypothetical protein [Chryseobacterium antibioticum]